MAHHVTGKDGIRKELPEEIRSRQDSKTPCGAASPLTIPLGIADRSGNYLLFGFAIHLLGSIDPSWIGLMESMWRRVPEPLTIPNPYHSRKILIILWFWKRFLRTIAFSMRHILCKIHQLRMFARRILLPEDKS